MTNYLTSQSFTSLVPEGVTVPEDEGVPGVALRSSVATTVASLMLVLAAIVCALFM